ncbi:cation/H(+) antiporter 10-like [Euphorbia lathyris]|uniref:cation/H(+) antiporter 10-like n=1 Tax=Euphorbia lathyris TaxID=212925 RepID=UPI0033144553
MWRKVKNSTMFCTHLPPKVNSQGIWSNDENPVLEHTLPLLELQAFLLFTITKALHLIFKPVGLPRIFSQIIAGIIMGPEVFGRYFEEVNNIIFPMETIQTNQMLGLFTYVLFAFTIGVRIDFSLVYSAGKIAFFIGVIAVSVPFMVGIGANNLITKYFSLSDQESASILYLVSLLATTQFTDIILVLEDLKIINSELGRLCLSSGVVSSAFSITISYLTVISRISREISMPMGIASGMMVMGFVILLTIVVRPAMYWIINQTPEGRPIKGFYIYTIIGIALASGLLTSEIGHYVPLGTFLFGLAVPSGPPLGSAFVDKLDGCLSGFFMPFFVSNTMMTVRYQHVTRKTMITSAIISVIVWLTKFIACLGPPLYTRMPLGDALIVAFVISSKSIAELALYSLVEDSRAVLKETFVAVPFVLLFSSSVTSIAVKHLYDPSRKYANYRKRNIYYTQNHQALKILACVYKTDDIDNIIDLLNASNPTKENPVQVDVLHLIQLVGRATPVFISHQLQTRVISNKSYSEIIINTFTEYQNMNLQSVFVYIFTAISPLKLMHEDICTLALSKQTAMILLPFHRKWTLDGSIELEDDSKRTLNCSVLDKAPCSVGILIDYNNDHRNITSKVTINVCVLFIGGCDDREALTLAKRMRDSSSVNLTVLRLVAVNEVSRLDWDEMLDSEVLKDFKLTSMKKGEDEEGGEVRYIEEMVSDGGQTVKIIQAIGSRYELVIVGRRHNLESRQISGLVEWSEYPELGVLGDLLVASGDSHLKGLVLVVQQQTS